ncbi:MAG: aminotransferase class I/II-fold pyridoxal phosphate-dependent enzyme [Lachnospiraceae bacterium]|nr:aminotransferase class I/II-fold pyridoxal phosphate-dependent enzyme [Lachnospiraceae bacterium]
MTHKHGGDIYSYHDIKDFSANINFCGMPSSVREAAITAVDESIHYPDPECRSLRTALAEREKKLYAAVLPEHIICGNGAAELFYALAGAFRPEHALLAVPSFYEYEQALGAFGCKITRFPLNPEDSFSLGEAFLNAVSAFAGQFSSRRLMIILGNPNNPTGSVIETVVLRALIRLCGSAHILLVLDESFLDFLDEADQKKTISGAVKVPDDPNLFVIRSFTKIYALPGIRFGYGLCSDQKLLVQMRMLVQPWNVSHVAQKAAEAAASECEFARMSAEVISQNRQSLICALQDAGLTVFPAAANFLLVRGPEGLKDACLKYGILIRDCGNFPGLEFSGDGRGYFRVCVRSQAENEELVKVIRQCLEECDKWQKQS